MLQFGMPTLIEIDSLEHTMHLCRELGLSFVELNMNLPQFQVTYLENVTYLRELKEKYRVGFTIHLDENLNVCDFNTAVAKAYTDTVVRTIQVAKALDIPVLNVHMNHGVYFTLPVQKVQLYEKYFEEYMESWITFCAICENAISDAGIVISIENTNGYTDYEKSAIDYALKRDIFGLTWDIGHSNSVADIDETFISDHCEKLCHFHIHDSLGKQDHMALGDGEVDLAKRLRIAEDRQCRCVEETKTVGALKESVLWLQKNGYL